ncbi:MAG: sugar transferase [Candidatus Krumholzibacteriia bacterium]
MDLQASAQMAHGHAVPGWAGGRGAVAGEATPFGPGAYERGWTGTAVRADRPAYRAYKRALDVLIAVVALTVFLMVLPLIALAIKIDSPGPVFFMQDRVGMNRRRRARQRVEGERRKVLQPGRPIRIVKLRTMRTDAEKDGPRWAQKNDARVTRVGKVLRKTRLDEVPQFANVLAGQMSLIGPRPERLHFVRQLEQEIPQYHERLLVQPGITGLAQVLNGYDEDTDSVRRKVELDRRYIQDCSVVQDLRILLGTVRVVLKGEGAH